MNERILVVANAIGARNRDHWEPPIDPAFTADEIKALHDWVNDGGALLLIIDHVPFPQAANALVTAKRMFARNLRAVVGEYAADEGEISPGIELCQNTDLIDN